MPTPPIAPKRPYVRELHGESVPDPWFWLREREDPAVIEYLEAENSYALAMMEHTAGLQQTIFDEIKARTQETDLDVPAQRGEYWYATRTEEGKPYRIWVRMHGTPDGLETLMLDENDLAASHDYFRSANITVSPDGRVLAYAVDTTGAERYVTRFRDLATGADLPDVIPLSYYSGAWASDGEHYFYTTPNDAMRPWQVWRHRLGSDAGKDVLVHQEDDERYFLHLRRSRSGEVVFIDADSAMTADSRWVAADAAQGPPLPVLPRVEGVQYFVDHRGSDFWIVTNDEGRDGRLIRMPANGGQATEVVPHETGVKLQWVDAFADHVVVWGRDRGLPGALVVRDDGTRRWLEFDESVYEVGPGDNFEFDAPLLRIGYQSPVTPPSVLDVDVTTGERTLLKQTAVLGGVDRGDYTATRAWADARDGTRVPVSVVRRADVPLDGSAPLVVYAYGAYEISMPAAFSIARLSLLDRGLVYAIAHVRGGGEMGKAWHEEGRLADKRNTFTDLIDVVTHLTEAGYGDPGRVASIGQSAGGLTVAGACRLAPRAFRAVVAGVPFVDVVNTMLDESLPLTIGEWEEWGNPAVADEYAWIRAYAPYEDVSQCEEYPAILATAGLNDPRVSYWEPAKWVAKLRAAAAGRLLLLKTEMGAGHFARSARYERWEDEAFEQAFLLDQLGVV